MNVDDVEIVSVLSPTEKAMSDAVEAALAAIQKPKVEEVVDSPTELLESPEDEGMNQVSVTGMARKSLLMDSRGLPSEPREPGRWPIGTSSTPWASFEGA